MNRHRKGSCVELHPANLALRPIFVEEGKGELKIRVVGLIGKPRR